MEALIDLWNGAPIDLRTATVAQESVKKMSTNGRYRRKIGIGDASRRRPSHTTWHTGPYRGGSAESGLGGRIDSGKTEGVEIAVAQRLLDQRVS
jgi:hypothetical protein